MMFQEQLALLQGQMERVSLAQLAKQENLAKSIQSTVEGLNQEDDGGGSTKTTTTTPAPSTIAAVSSPQQLEERLKRLEVTLGAAGSSSSTNQSKSSSLLDRLEALEQIQAKVDDKKVDLVQKRVKVIRQDLEAAAKARNKLMAVGGSLAHEDSKSIAALYDQLQQLQGCARHLPVLAERLQALAHQHVEAATRAHRLRAVEQLTGHLAQQVAAAETAVGKLESSSLPQNAASMQESMQALEERMKALSSSLKK